jgi:hypothetical protein
VLIAGYSIFFRPEAYVYNGHPPLIGIPSDVQEEINNTEHYGFNVTSNMLAASSLSQCTRIKISSCDNNVPNQFVCVNEAYSLSIISQYGIIYKTSYPGMEPGTVCPMFLVPGKLTCGLSGGYCTVVLYSNYSS